MKRRMVFTTALLGLVMLFAVACEEGTDDWNSSARIVGDVYTDASHTHGVQGVQVILEADPTAQAPYEGPDRWTVTDANGHFDGAVFLGNKDGKYNYVADMAVGYFYHEKSFKWTGGITVGPGSTFTLPPVDTTMFQPVGGQ
jgi:hypothetical protein